MATTIVKPTGPVELPGQESTRALRHITPQTDALAAQTYLPEVDPQSVEQAMMIGDLSQMTPNVRIAYYVATCRSVGLNPLTRPFQALKADDGSIVLYPDKGCAEQLRKRDRISTRIVSREYVDDLYIVTAEASTPDGRKEESEGVVVVMETMGEWKEGTKRNGDTYRYKEDKYGADGQPILKRLTGTQMANARMRAETKAKRRATLAICGLGMPDAGEGHPMRFDPQRGTLEDGEDVVDVIPTQVTREQGKSKEDHIEDLTGTRPGISSASILRYVPQIEALVLACGGTPATFWGWAERQRRKPQAQFTADDYADLLARAQSQAAVRKAEQAQQAAKNPQEGQQVPTTPPGAQDFTQKARSDLPDASNAIADEFANVDPETGEVFDLHASAALDRELEREMNDADESDPF